MKRPWSVCDEVWYRMALRALDEGHQIFVAGERLVIESEKIASLIQRGVKVCYRHPFRPARLYHLKERLFSDLHHLEQFEPDVVLFSGGYMYDALNQPALLGFCQRLRSPLVYLGHAHSEFFPMPNRDKLQAFLQSLACIVFVSEGNRSTLRWQLGMALPNSVVVRNVPFITPQWLPMPDGPQVRLACVARLEAFIKGHDVLLNVLGDTIGTKQDWHLDICGEGPDLNLIRRLVNFYGLEQRVTFCGQIQDIAGLWRNTHALVLASRAEGLANVVLEAMAYGRLVVTTDVGGHCEVISDGVDGIIADAATPRSYGAALNRAWALREQWPEIGRAAHERMKRLIAQDREGQLLQVLLNCARQGRDNTVHSKE